MLYFDNALREINNILLYNKVDDIYSAVFYDSNHFMFCRKTRGLILYFFLNNRLNDDNESNPTVVEIESIDKFEFKSIFSAIVKRTLLIYVRGDTPKWVLNIRFNVLFDILYFFDNSEIVIGSLYEECIY